jgi:hypothetical protein
MLALLPPEDYRARWTQSLRVHLAFRNHEDRVRQAIGVTEDLINDCLTALFMREELHLRTCSIDPMCITNSTAVALATHNISSLSLLFEYKNLEVLSVLSSFNALNSLTLQFNKGDLTKYQRIRTAPPKFDDNPALSLPTVTRFTLVWRCPIHLHVDSGLQYFASCQFSHTCRLEITLTLKSVYNTTRSIPLLNPLFLRHRSNSVVLSCEVPAQSQVFSHADSVQFRVHMPHANLFNTARLPRFISLYLMRATIDQLWDIFDMLLNVPFGFDTYVHIRSEIFWRGSPRDVMLLWTGESEVRSDTWEMPQEYHSMMAELKRYAPKLAMKGIHLLDGYMKTMLGETPELHIIPEELLRTRTSAWK